MAIEKARKHLEQFGLDGMIREFTVSSATVALAAEALGCEPARIAKSLTFMGSEGAIMVVAAGDARVDNKKFKERFGVKAKMLTPEQVDALIGHSIGGVCPFGVNPGVEVYLDESMKRFEVVFPACGSSNSCVELTLPQLEQASGTLGWVDVCKFS